MNIAILGGSFNPAHLAHQMACLVLLEGEGFEQVWLLPTFKHAFSKKLAPFADRMEMCRRLSSVFSGRVVVCDLESRLCTEQGNRSIDTMDALKSMHPGHAFTLVIGSDLLPETAKWKEFDRLRREVDFLVLQRDGFLQADYPAWRTTRTTLPQIASSSIRAALQAKDSIQGLVPEAVRRYIEEHELYQDD